MPNSKLGSNETPSTNDIDRLMNSARQAEDLAQNRRHIDEAKIKLIVKITLNEIFDGVGVDLVSKEGRERFRAQNSWVGDAMDGTTVLRKTAFGAVIATFVTGAAFGLWTMLVWVASLTDKFKGH